MRYNRLCRLIICKAFAWDKKRNIRQHHMILSDVWWTWRDSTLALFGWNGSDGKNQGEALYIINSVRNCISSTVSTVVYHHCESYTHFVWWYTPAAMIYSLAADDIPLLSQRIKKFPFKRTRIFLVDLKGFDSRTAVLGQSRLWQSTGLSFTTARPSNPFRLTR